MRVAHPVRRRLTGVILDLVAGVVGQSKLKSNPGVLSDSFLMKVLNRGDVERLRQLVEAVLIQSGCLASGSSA